MQSFSEYERITILNKIRDHECKICTRAKKCDPVGSCRFMEEA